MKSSKHFTEDLSFFFVVVVVDVDDFDKFAKDFSRLLMKFL